MKKIINWAFTILFSILILMYVGTVAVGAPSLAYVYSESMEPLIKVNDGFREGTTAARRLIEDTAFGGDAGPEPLFVDDDPTSPDLRAIFTDPTLN